MVMDLFGLEMIVQRMKINRCKMQ